MAGLKRAGRNSRGRGNCVRPESKRDKIVCLIVASDDPEANDGTFEAGYTCAVFCQSGGKTQTHLHTRISALGSCLQDRSSKDYGYADFSFQRHLQG